jgi:hypothetical protein
MGSKDGRKLRHPMSGLGHVTLAIGEAPRRHMRPMRQPLPLPLSLRECGPHGPRRGELVYGSVHGHSAIQLWPPMGTTHQPLD